MLRKISWSLLFFFIFGGVFEFVAQEFASPHTVEVDVGMQLQPDFTRIWALKTGRQQQFGVWVTVDDRQMRYSSESHSHKWLTLGDSSIFGHALEDSQTLHEQLERQLSHYQRDVDVLCGAVPGYSILQTQRYLDDIGWDLNPQVLILGSLWSDNNFDHFVDREWLELLDSPQSQILYWLSKSATFLWLHQELNPVLKQQQSIASKISWVREPYGKGQRRVSLEDYSQGYLEILQEAQKRNIAVLILQPANRYRLEGMNVEATWDVYFRVQQQIAEHAQVPIIDVAAVLRLFGLSSAEAFVDELHPSATANYWIAQTIADKALSENLQDWVPNIEGDFVLTEVDYWKGTNEVNPNADLPLE